MTGPTTSGLRNPTAAVRGVGAGTLVAEALILLLAIAPLAKLGGDRSGLSMALAGGLAVLALLFARLLRHRWVWYAAYAVPVALLASGWLHWAFPMLGLIFGPGWLYVLHVRRSVLGGSDSASGGGGGGSQVSAG
jgi:hypothetical protein